jgi:class 3 adenylate cyclase
MEIPETRYAKTPDGLSLAYQVLGAGSTDLVYFWGLGSHLELFWDYGPNLATFGRLGTFARLILFDRRGVGASDRTGTDAPLTCEELTEDVAAVMDAVDARSAAVLAEVDAGPIATMFAAMHPERVSALVLCDTSARYLSAADYPIGVAPADVDAAVDLVDRLWGTPELAELAFSGVADDQGWSRWWAKMVRASITPRTAATQYRYVMNGVDVRSALPSIRAPTLILHHAQNAFVPLSHGRFLAKHISDARLVELPGAMLGLAPADANVWVNEIAEFLTGHPAPGDLDRALATVLFTDIVASTEHATRLGDKKWTDLLSHHNELVNREIERHRGRLIDTAGDGALASFDGPARAVRCAQAIIESIRPLGIEVRAGLHTGEVELRGDDIGGIAVHIGQRVSSLAGPGEVLVSRTVTDLVAGSGLEFEERGEHELKGVAGKWAIYAVRS